MGRTAYALIFAFCLGGGWPAHAGEKIIDPRTNASIEYDAMEAPKVLYHWTSLNNLKLMAGDRTLPLPFPDFVSLKKSRSKLVGDYPGIAASPKGGMFAWTHPTLAMMGNGSERYGTIPLRMEIDPRARVLKLDAGGWIYSTAKSWAAIDFSRVNLILNDYPSEWVIVNPAVITDATADPRILRETYLTEIPKLLDPDHKFPKEQIHYHLGNEHSKDAATMKTYRHDSVQIIKDFLAMPPERLPRAFRHPLSLQEGAKEIITASAKVAARAGSQKLFSLLRK